MPDQYRQLTPQHKGWRRVWDVIALRFGDPSCYNPLNGETWQYMGTVNDTHQFRHRCLSQHDADHAGMPGWSMQKVNINLSVLSDDFDPLAAPCSKCGGTGSDTSVFPIQGCSICSVVPTSQPVSPPATSQPAPFDFDTYNSLQSLPGKAP